MYEISDSKKLKTKKDRKNIGEGAGAVGSEKIMVFFSQE